MLQNPRFSRALVALFSVGVFFLFAILACDPSNRSFAMIPAPLAPIPEPFAPGPFAPVPFANQSESPEITQEGVAQEQGASQPTPEETSVQTPALPADDIGDSHRDDKHADDEPAAAGPSDAERIAELQKTIEEDQKQLGKLEAELADPESEYAKADRDFRELNESFEKHTEQLQAARDAKDEEAIEKLTKEVESIERLRKLAQERFDLEIESRKTLREEMQSLRSKIKKDQEALDDLTGESMDLEAEDSRSAKQSNKHSDDENRTSQHHRDHQEDATSERSDSQDSSDSHRGSEDSKDEEEEDEEIRAAKAEAEAKEQAAEEAEAETKSLEARIADLQKLVHQEQKEQLLARRKVDLATSAQQSLQEELQKRQAENADAAELADLRSAATEASQRVISARGELAEIAERLNDHRAELGSLQSEHIVALNEAKVKQQEAKEAENRVASLSNPFALRNLLQWLIDHGPRLIAIVVGMFLINRIAFYFSMRSIQFVSSGTNRGSKVERENRAKTLVGVFQNAASVAIFVSGCLMILEEIGVNITVLMGGVAVVGLAVAFGAQNLIKDYFYGFVMLLENQYMLNDTIQIGGVSGQVERITLRMTVLRDSNGVVHFIPNGTINSVSNETHGWSRAVCEVAIGYEEDLDLVLRALSDLSAEMNADPKFGPLILDASADPSIESLGESSIRIKTAIKTIPNKHGTVKQEWMRRVHRKFLELNVDPPYPQRSLHVKTQASIDGQSLQVKRSA